MADSTTLINEFSKSALVYEGYLTIRTGIEGDFVYKKYDQLMELSIDVIPEIVTHFNSTKKKHNVVVGDNSAAIISLKDTVDLYRKSADPVDLTTMTDIKKELRNNMKVVPATFVSIQKTESTTNPDFIIEIIVGDIIAVRKRRNLDTGDYTDEIEFSISTITPESADADPVPPPS